jgi:hypothetical protein
MVSGSGRKFIAAGSSVFDPLSVNRSAPLLRNVNLFFFVYVAKEVYQTTNKGDCCQSKRDPSRSVSGRGRLSNKLVEIEYRADGGGNSHQNRENIFQAFHFEPPARKLVMKVKEKAAKIFQIKAAW